MPASRPKKASRAKGGNIQFRRVKPTASSNASSAKKAKAAPRKTVAKKAPARQVPKQQGTRQTAKRDGVARRKASRQLKDGFPTWDTLSSKDSRPKKAGRKGEGFLQTLPTFRVALLILVLAGGITLYVGHVLATQSLLADLQDVRRENQQLHLKYNRLKGDFDRATGPAAIYERAHALGLREGIAYGATIQIK